MIRPVRSATEFQPSICASDFREDDNTYVNWPHLDNDSAIGPSPVNEIKNNDKEEEPFSDSSVYDLPSGNSHNGENITACCNEHIIKNYGPLKLYYLKFIESF